jgi:hypothetical protein
VIGGPAKEFYSRNYKPSHWHSSINGTRKPTPGQWRYGEPRVAKVSPAPRGWKSERGWGSHADKRLKKAKDGWSVRYYEPSGDWIIQDDDEERRGRTYKPFWVAYRNETKAPVAWLVVNTEFRTLAQALAFVKKQKGKRWPQPEPYPQARYPRRKNPEWLEEEREGEGELIDLTPPEPLHRLPPGRWRLGDVHIGGDVYPGAHPNPSRDEGIPVAGVPGVPYYDRPPRDYHGARYKIRQKVFVPRSGGRPPSLGTVAFVEPFFEYGTKAYGYEVIIGWKPDGRPRAKKVREDELDPLNMRGN